MKLDGTKEPEMVVAKPCGSVPPFSGDAVNAPSSNGGSALQTSETIAQSAADRDDYGGMPLDEWKAALKKDVEDRFGPIPKDLKPAGEAGW
jgi:hypothetical protein